MDKLTKTGGTRRRARSTTDLGSASIALLIVVLAGSACVGQPFPDGPVPTVNPPSRLARAVYELSGTVDKVPLRGRLTLSDDTYTLELGWNTCKGAMLELALRTNAGETAIDCGLQVFTFRVRDSHLDRAHVTIVRAVPPRRERVCTAFDYHGRCESYVTQLVPQLPEYRDYRLKIARTAAVPG